MINFKNKFRVFNLFNFFLIIISIIQVAKSTIFELNNTAKIDINPWAYSDLLINYQAGFVRRGLLGNLIYISDQDGVIYNNLYIFVFLNFCFFVLLIILNLNLLPLNSFQKFLFHISIFGTFNMTLFGNYFARKEIFILNLFLIITLVKQKVNLKFFILICSFFGIIAILIHEGIGFFLFYPFTIFLIKQKNGNESFVNLFRLLMFFTFLTSFVFRGGESVSQGILDSISQTDLNLLDGLNPNAITFLNSNLFDALEMLYILIFSGSLILWGVFFIFIIVTLSIVFNIDIRKIYNDLRSRLSDNKDFFIIFALFVLGWDWGRWILTLFYFILFGVLIDIKESKNKIYSIYHYVFFVSISIITSMPPCCLEMSGTKVSSNFFRIYKSFEISFLQFLN